MRLANAFGEEVRRKVGHAHVLLIPEGEPQWRARREPYRLPSSIADLYPDNVSLANQMGFGTAESVRGRSREAQRRRSFLGRIRHWRRGDSSPGRQWLPRMQAAARREQRRRATPRTVAQVVDLMLTYGVTVGRMEFEMAYDDRHRDVRAEVFIRPEVLASYGFADAFRGSRAQWGPAAEAFVAAWSHAYSGDPSLFAGNVDDVEVLSFRLGKSPDATYGYGLVGNAA